jgi:hypothetical protein
MARIDPCISCNEYHNNKTAISLHNSNNNNNSNKNSDGDNETGIINLLLRFLFLQSDARQRRRRHDDEYWSLLRRHSNFIRTKYLYQRIVPRLYREHRHRRLNRRKGGSAKHISFGPLIGERNEYSLWQQVFHRMR